MEIKLVVVGIREIYPEGLDVYFMRHPVGSHLYLRIEPEGERFPGAVQVLDDKSMRVGYISKIWRRFIENDVRKQNILKVTVAEHWPDDKAIIVYAEKTEPDAPPFISHIEKEPNELVFDTTEHDKKIQDASDLLNFRIKELDDGNLPDSETDSLLHQLEDYSRICCSSLDGDTTFKRADVMFSLLNNLERYPKYYDVYRSIFEDTKDLGRRPNDVKIRVYKEQYDRIRKSAFAAQRGKIMSQVEAYWQSLVFANSGKTDVQIIEQEMDHLSKLLVVMMYDRYVSCSQSDEDFATSIYALNYDLRSLYILYTRRIKYDFLCEKLKKLTCEGKPVESAVGSSEGKQPMELCVELNSTQCKMLGKAEKAGIISYNAERKGYDKGKLSSKALVAYLCGRLFCGDKVKGGEWIEGIRFYDAKYCNELFGFDVAATRRKCRNSGTGKPPKGHKKVDDLFKEN